MSTPTTPQDPIEDARRRLIFAADVPDMGKASWYASHLANTIGFIKVGPELFAAAGPGGVRELVARGLPVFADFKLHDIPATVARSITALSKLGVRLITVHASGGPAMLRAAVEAAHQASDRPKLLGVTVLTSLSTSDLAAVGIGMSVRDLVVKRAALCRDAGLDGIVTSVEEAAAVRFIAPEPFLVVTPGIRSSSTQAGDQKRVGSAAAALQAGASHVVVGRAIRDAEDPVAAAGALVEEMARALPPGAGQPAAEK